MYTAPAPVRRHEEPAPEAGQEGQRLRGEAEAPPLARGLVLLLSVVAVIVVAVVVAAVAAAAAVIVTIHFARRPGHGPQGSRRKSIGIGADAAEDLQLGLAGWYDIL